MGPGVALVRAGLVPARILGLPGRVGRALLLALACSLSLGPRPGLAAHCFEDGSISSTTSISGPGPETFRVLYNWPGSGSSWAGTLTFAHSGAPPGVSVRLTPTSTPFAFPGAVGSNVVSTTVDISFDSSFVRSPVDFDLVVTARAISSTIRGPTCSSETVSHTYRYRAPVGAAPAVPPAPAAFEIQATPPTITVAPGDSATFRVSIIGSADTWVQVVPPGGISDWGLEFGEMLQGTWRRIIYAGMLGGETREFTFRTQRSTPEAIYKLALNAWVGQVKKTVFVNLVVERPALVPAPPSASVATGASGAQTQASPPAGEPISPVPSEFGAGGPEPSTFSLSLVLGGEEEIVEGSGPGLGWRIGVHWTGEPQPVSMEAGPWVVATDPPGYETLRQDTVRPEWVAGRSYTLGRAPEESLLLHLAADRLPASIGHQYPVSWIDTEVIATSEDGTQQQLLTLPRTTVFSCSADWVAALPANRLLNSAITHQLTAGGRPRVLPVPGSADEHMEWREFDEATRRPLIAFRRSTPAIISWVNLGPVFPTAPNVLTWEWVDPEGNILPGATLTLLQTDQRCAFWTEQEAADNLPVPEPEPGLWRANVFIDDEVLISQVFRVE